MPSILLVGATHHTPVIREVLAEEGWNVTVASNHNLGIMALDMNPDVVVTDMGYVNDNGQYEERAGLHFIDDIQSRAPSLPVIGMSNPAQFEVELTAKNVPCVVKTADSNVLGQQVRDAIQKFLPEKDSFAAPLRRAAAGLT